MFLTLSNIPPTNTGFRGDRLIDEVLPRIGKGTSALPRLEFLMLYRKPMAEDQRRISFITFSLSSFLSKLSLKLRVMGEGMI